MRQKQKQQPPSSDTTASDKTQSTDKGVIGEKSSNWLATTAKWNRFVSDERGTQVYTAFSCLTEYKDENCSGSVVLEKIKRRLFGNPCDSKNHYGVFKIERYQQIKQFWIQMSNKKDLVFIKFEPNDLEV
jgi:hypothetical protein